MNKDKLGQPDEAALQVAGRCEEDSEIRAVVLTGSGRMFCAGGDLKTFAAQGDRLPSDIPEVVQVFHGAMARCNDMAAPVVAAINGTAAGGGLSLALSTDLAMAAESAKFPVATFTRQVKRFFSHLAT